MNLSEFHLRVTYVRSGDYFWKMAFSPDGVWLATTSTKNLVLVWEVGTGKLAHKLVGHTRGTSCVAWSPDGKLLASGSLDETICLWETTSWRLRRQLVGHNELVFDLEWSADGRWLKSKSHRNSHEVGPGGKVCVWDVLGDMPMQVSKMPQNESPQEYCATHGKLRATSSPYGGLHFWAADSGKLLRTLCGRNVKKTAWSPDESLLAARLDDGAVQIWDTATAQLLHTFDDTVGSPFLHQYRDWSSLVWSPDGKWLATDHDKYAIKVWEAASGKLLRTLSVHKERVQHIDVRHMAWSPDGQRLVSSASDRWGNAVQGELRLWDAVQGKLLWSSSTPNDAKPRTSCLHWSGDGGSVTGLFWGGTLCQWDVSNTAIPRPWTLERIVRSLFGSGTLDECDVSNTAKLRTWRLNEGNDVYEAWSPDGTLIVAYESARKKIRLWETASGKLWREWEGKAGNPIAISPDQKLLATAVPNDEITVWSVETGAELKTFATGLSGGRLAQAEFVSAASPAKEFGQTYEGLPAIVVTTFAL